MIGDILLTASVVAWHVVTWPVVAILAVSAVRRWQTDPGFVVVAGALATVLVGWNVLIRAGSSRLALGAASAALAVLLATFPDGRFVPRWLAAPVLVLAGVGVTSMFAELPIGARLIVNWSTLLLIVAQVHRYRRRATTPERASARWAILGTLITLTGCLLLLPVTGAPTGDDSGALTLALANLAVLPMPVALAVGLLRPQLLDVDSALRVVVAGLVVLVFAGAAAAAADLGLRRAGADATLAGRLTSLLAVAAALGIARVATRAADRLVYRGRPDPGQSARDLGMALAAEPDPSKVPGVLLSEVQRALGVERAELRPDDPAAQWFRVPVVYQDERLATLVVSPRAGETSLTRRDVAVLRRLALHAAPALHGARTHAELNEARSRVVRLRAEERKALRRDIHDDLGPTLAGLGLSAAAVAELVKNGDAEAAPVADSLVADVHSAMAQVRELTRDLRPPILDEEGLVATIRARLHSQQSAPLVVVEAPDERLVLPAAVELAALRIVQEAVSNVRRHARAARCAVSLRMADDVLHLTVRDDGTGFAPDRPRGLGLASIRERAEELGGNVVFDSSPGGGVRVSVTLPGTSVTGPLPAVPSPAAGPQIHQLQGCRSSGAAATDDEVPA